MLYMDFGLLSPWTFSLNLKSLKFNKGKNCFLITHIWWNSEFSFSLVSTKNRCNIYHPAQHISWRAESLLFHLISDNSKFIIHKRVWGANSFWLHEKLKTRMLIKKWHFHEIFQKQTTNRGSKNWIKTKLEVKQHFHPNILVLPVQQA